MPHRWHGWQIYLGSRNYKAALEWQKRMVRYRLSGSLRDTLFYMEHPDVITIGRDCSSEEKSSLPEGVELFRISRGGGYTYHGPGQLVAYPVFDLQRRGKDLHKFIRDLEEGIILAFGSYGLKCGRRKEYTGVWTGDRKIASIGVAVCQWVTYHGAAVNLTTDLNKFAMIHPCGLKPETMTSARKELGIDIGLEEFAGKLTEVYAEIFETAFGDVDLEELAEMVRMEESTQSL